MNKRWLQIALWIAIPVVVLTAAECVFLVRYPFPTHYWKPVDEAAQQGTIDFLFLGDSQVACAIDVEVFAEEMTRPGETKPVVVNAGMGWSMPFQYYLGLSRLVREHPEALRGCTVLLDAPGELPTYGIKGRNLFYAERPDFLWSLVGWRELPALCDTNPAWEQRSRLAASWFLGQSALLTRANQIGSGLVDRTRRTFVAAGCSPRVSAPSASIDLSRAGGVRIDAHGVALVKDIVARASERELRHQKPLTNWEGTDVAAIVKLVQDAGGQVVFYRMPLHSAQACVYETDIRKTDRAKFREQAATWGTRFVEPEYRETDADFPDHLHLAASRAAEFSVALARSVISSQGPVVLLITDN